jgi:hypothetical protein
MAMPGTDVSLAALVFRDGEEINSTVLAFAMKLEQLGVRLGGIVQIARDSLGCDCPETHVLDLASGQRLPILQNLGAHSQSCRIDSSAIAIVSGFLNQAIESKADIIFVNRFGKLEAEGKGLFAEIAAAALAGIPTLVCVSAKYLEAWREFASDLAVELPCSADALHQWWSRLAPKASELQFEIESDALTP